MSLFIQNNNGPVYTDCTVTINYKGVKVNGERLEVNGEEAEDVKEVDTSFFCTDRYDAALCEKNLREAIDQAKSKADACRRIMLLETCGYIILSNVKDERKAELINPFAAGKYMFSGEDFRKARAQ